MDKKKILIVEDEALIAMTIEEALTHMDYDVCGPISNGNKLAASIEKCRPDLILMDIMLPGDQDGIDLANVVNDIYKIPIVFLTASSNKSVFDRAKKADSYGYLIKPFNNRDLKNTIELALYKFEAQSLIAKSEEKYKSLFELATNEVYLIDPLSLKVVDANSKALNNIGYSKEEIRKMKLTDFTPSGPGSVKEKFGVITSLIRGKEASFTAEHKRKDGSLYPIEIKAKVVKIENKKLIQAYGVDVTDKVLAKKVQNVIFNVSNKGNQIVDFQEYFSSINNELKGLFNFENFYVNLKKEDRLEFIYHNKHSLTSLKSLERTFENGFSEYVINKGEPIVLGGSEIDSFARKNELQIHRKKPKSWIGYPFKNIQGDVIGNFSFLSYSNDFQLDKVEQDLLVFLSGQVGLFVQKKLSEKELKKSEERNTAILQAIPDIMFRTTVEGLYLDYHVNDKGGVLLPKQASPKVYMQDVLPKEIWEPELELSKKVVSTGIQEVFEYEYKGKSFECRIVKSGKDEVLKIIRDVTFRKRLTKDLEDSEKKYRTIYEKSPVGILSVTEYGEVSSINEYLLKMIGYDSVDLVGKSMAVLLPKEVDVRKHDMWMKGFFRKPEVRGMVIDEREVHIIHKDGSRIPVVINLSYVKDEMGTMGLALIQNISHKKQAEETQKSLAEKELLLKEIHHRVKNNMQVISSLLSLQSMSIDDESIREKFNESQNRISSMSLIHEKLYQTENLNEIDFSDYLKDLVPYIINSFPVSTSLSVNYDLTTLNLPLEQAIPCGLILNEILSNSLKYAFKGRPVGEITVKCRENNGYAELYVGDNGIGIESDLLTSELKSLGLKLVKSLTKQLGGELEIKSEGNGTHCTLKLLIADEKGI